MFTPTLLRVYSDNPFIKHLKLGDYKKTKSKEDAQWQKAYRQAARMGVVLTRRPGSVPRAEGPRGRQEDHESLFMVRLWS